MKELTYEQALHRLAADCSRTERCVQDVRKKMENWELSADVQKKILQYLQKEKYIDEQRFCRAFVNDKSQYNRWGAYKIGYELKKKNIPGDFIREALQNLDATVLREQLTELLEKKQKTVKGKNEYEIRQKIIRFAAGRGFSLEEIEAALSNRINRCD
ncbi:regulatory protein RecX [Bacteroidia bacterium]|nr:regulatory protein RecX [Bacteroidia bacterium]